jgi:hypothetical protein
VEVPVGKFKKIALATLLIVLSPVILVFILFYVIAQIPSSIVRGRQRARREKTLQAQMAATGRLMPWAELRSKLDANFQGTLIDEDGGDDLINTWWSPEDIATVSPHLCCFKRPTKETMHDFDKFHPFFEWCRSRFTSPESGTALLVVGGAGQEYWSFLEDTEARPWVYVKRLP